MIAAMFPKCLALVLNPRSCCRQTADRPRSGERRYYRWLFATFAMLALTSDARSADFPEAFFKQHCYDCHGSSTQKGEIRLDTSSKRDWGKPDSQVFFERVLDVLKAGEMPPETVLPASEVEPVIEYLHQQLLAHSQIGGTVLRRLNRQEYENTIESLFDLEFNVPDGFPGDQVRHGFDNVGADLVLSPPLMEAYFESAVTVADRLFPPLPRPVKSTAIRHLPKEMAISYSSSMVIDGSMRLAQRTPTVIRSCTWPTSFEAKASGRYRVVVKLSAIGKLPDDKPMQLHVYAKNIALDKGNDDNPLKLRRLAAYEVASGSPEWFECEATLYRNETPLFFYANAPLDSTDPKSFETYLRSQFKSNPRLLAGWMAVKHGRGLRGGVGWDRVKAKMADDRLDLSQAKLGTPAAEKIIKTMAGNAGSARQYVESISYQIFEEGPSVGIHETVIEGPLELVEDEEDRARQLIHQRFVGKAAKLDGQAKVEVILKRFLPLAFRRPVTKDEVQGYADIVMEHMSAGHRFDDGMHLAIRTALVSPNFLYRETNPGRLDDFGLASRLSYFLTSGPPDRQLRELAAAGQLHEKKVLKAEVYRLIQGTRSRGFVSDFTGQWLGTRRLAEIMPDQKLLDFKPSDRDAMIAETELFFTEVLLKNLPLETFIKPDFTFLNQDLATRIYGRTDVKSKRKMTRASVSKDSPYGGILGQASVMMATANGVDTQPVLRGVWVQENVLGDPPPPPPMNVPAITPDTRGAKTVRDLMAAHTSKESCAGCHRKIDPPGFVLENFDPIGRWRTNYPVWTKGELQSGPRINVAATMPDGTELQSVRDLKSYVVRHIDRFGQCLSEKLMTYATGRHLSYADRHEISTIVQRTREASGGFQDLFIALILSETFATK
ncbi:MAG: hypothetical protein ACI93T_002482, partial [Porticoccaceae bacterium]